jgi:hypothetical protein
MPHAGYKKPVEETAAYKREHGKQIRYKSGKNVGRGNPHPTKGYTERNLELQELAALKKTKAECPGTVDFETLSENNQRIINSFFKIAENGNLIYTPDDIKNAIIDYISHGMQENENAPETERRVGYATEKVKKIQWVPSILGFCVYAGIPSASYYTFNKKTEYKDICVALKDYCQQWTMDEMLKERLPAIPAIFVGKAQYGMIEAQAEQTITVKHESMDNQQLDEIFSKYKQAGIEEQKIKSIEGECHEVDNSE